MKKRTGFTPSEKRAIWERDAGVCQLCHASIISLSKAEIHHIKPMAAGGDEHDIDNGMTLHKECHHSKFEELHGHKFTAIRAIRSKKGMKWWIYQRNRKGDESYE